MMQKRSDALPVLRLAHDSSLSQASCVALKGLCGGQVKAQVPDCSGLWEHSEAGWGSRLKRNLQIMYSNHSVTAHFARTLYLSLQATCHDSNMTSHLS